MSLTLQIASCVLILKLLCNWYNELLKEVRLQNGNH